MVFTSIVLPSPLQQKREIISKPALNRIGIQSIYCFNYCLHMKFGTAALLGDSCTRQLSSCLGDKAQGLSPQLIPQKFPPNTPEIRSGADPAAPWDAVDVSVLHNGGSKLKCNRKDEIAQIQSRARLGWVTQRGFFSSSWRPLQYVLCSSAGPAKICLLTPWLQVPSSFKRAKPAHTQAPSPSQSLPIAQTLTNNSAELSHHQTRARMLCSTSSCCGFCCGNQFGLEPSSDDSWHSPAPAAPEGHCQLYHPCDKANTPRIHRAATSSIGSLHQQLTLGGKDAKKVKAV